MRLENGGDIAVADIRLFTTVLYEPGNRSVYRRLRDGGGMVISFAGERTDLTAADSERLFWLLQENEHLPGRLSLDRFIKWEAKLLNGKRIHTYEGVE